jgi:methionine-rich copper-binding protein CopC
MAVAAYAAAATGPALAHAFLTRASPAVGSTVHALPAEITLSFTEGVEPAFCQVQVVAPGGDRIDSGSLHVDAGAPAVLHVALKAPPAGGAGVGDYKVVWRAVSVDTHTTSGDFTFKVAP